MKDNITNGTYAVENKQIFSGEMVIFKIVKKLNVSSIIPPLGEDLNVDLDKRSIKTLYVLEKKAG